jgi:hypothetical protein
MQLFGRCCYLVYLGEDFLANRALVRLYADLHEEGACISNLCRASCSDSLCRGLQIEAELATQTDIDVTLI